MTKIAPSHLLSARAVLAVSSLLNRVGALSEQIRNDYGEDLIVQTSVGTKVDPFRILVQVKGAKLSRRANGKYYFRFDIDHLRRWVSHADPVIVCIFDSESEKIYSFIPHDTFGLWELTLNRNRTCSVKFSDDDVFDEKAAHIFVWRARILHYSRSLAWFDSHSIPTSKKLSDRRSRRIQKEKLAITVDFLQSLNLFPEISYDLEFRGWIDNGLRNLTNPRSSTYGSDIAARDVFALAILARDETIAKQGLPSNLIEEGSHLCMKYFGILHPDILNEHFG